MSKNYDFGFPNNGSDSKVNPIKQLAETPSDNIEEIVVKQAPDQDSIMPSVDPAVQYDSYYDDDVSVEDILYPKKKKKNKKRKKQEQQKRDAAIIDIADNLTYYNRIREEMLANDIIYGDTPEERRKNIKEYLKMKEYDDNTRKAIDTLLSQSQKKKNKAKKGKN